MRKHKEKAKESEKLVDAKKLDELVKALEEKNEEIEKKENEIEDLKIEKIKLQEHFNKSRKTLEKQAEQRVLQKKKILMRDFLEILDNFERALEALNKDNESSTKEGIKLIYSQIQQFLNQHGVKEIKLNGKAFDPILCDIGRIVEENSKEPNTILETLRKGYYLNDEVLRTAIVAIAAPEKEKNKNKLKEGGK